MRAVPPDVEKVLLLGEDPRATVVDRYPAEDVPDNPLSEGLPLVSRLRRRPLRDWPIAMPAVHPTLSYSSLSLSPAPTRAPVSVTM